MPAEAGALDRVANHLLDAPASHEGEVRPDTCAPPSRAAASTTTEMALHDAKAGDTMPTSG